MLRRGPSFGHRRQRWLRLHKRRRLLRWRLCQWRALLGLLDQIVGHLFREAARAVPHVVVLDHSASAGTLDLLAQHGSVTPHLPIMLAFCDLLLE